MGRRTAILMVVTVALGVSGTSWGQKKASNPNPANGATDVIAALFRWTPGAGAFSHNVYLGTTPELGPAQLVGSREPRAWFYYQGGLTPGIVYFWRVDEVEADGVTVHAGDVWTFVAQPPTAFLPDPADGSNEAPVAPELRWLAGQGALKHHVYFGSSRTAVAEGTGETDKGVTEEPNYAPGTLEPTLRYFWRVDEIGPGDAVVTGAVWSFITALPVDDFESYNDAEGKGTRIYETWIDGWTGNNGSTVGYTDPPFAEQTIVHGGGQAMPLDYNNLTSPFYSEAVRQFTPAQDWTVNDVNTLVLYLRGRALDFEILSVSTPPVIDGKMDDVWKVASAQPIVTPIITVRPLSSSSQFRVLYDATNLYALVDVNDDKLRNDSPEAWYDDSVEFYIDGDNTKKGAGLDGNNRQYTFGWSATDVQGTNTNLTGVEFAQTNTPTGWRLEIKLPWQSLLGASAPVGKLIGIDCFYDDDDLNTGVQESQVAWHSKVEADWEIPASWGTALVARPQPQDAADRVYVALLDSSQRTGTVIHPDPQPLKAGQWVPWRIPLSDFADAGVNLAAVRKMFIGVGDRAQPRPGDTGLLFIDDIRLTRPMPTEP